MASTVARIGLNAKVYFNTATFASPTWLENSNVRDLTMDLDMDEGDASIRAGLGWAMSEPTLLKAALNWNMNHDPADTNGWDTINTAFFARSAKEILCIDRVTGSGAEGLRMTCKFHKFGKGEPLNGVQTTDTVAKPCINADSTPAWYVGA
jgi:hypothetical protein